MTKKTWIEVTTEGSTYIEQVDAQGCEWRHRSDLGTDWIEGRAPKPAPKMPMFQNEEERPSYDVPEHPLSIDEDGDIVDANGWLVACPARAVWKDDVKHREQCLYRLSNLYKGDSKWD